MNKSLQLSHKTYVPFCGLECCGNKFGRIERSKYARIHGRNNRMKLTRRYAKHVERQILRKSIQAELNEMYNSYDDDMELLHLQDESEWDNWYEYPYFDYSDDYYDESDFSDWGY